ncbi:hypothetical protein [Thermus thermamylovorans]|uniref:MgtC-like C-terminal domain-containing protein n=1 Tax=Thermus thermamylovorans TaxID=2509362 RepID=A0A4Q9B4V1_9DEIN|nr:hypothetical protein [Thermus thermamylovorans]TBH20686.1 hypothetical protein ETP66_06370 [Thermus thermamylovorans]
MPLGEAGLGALAILFVNLVVRRLARLLEGPGGGKGDSELEVVYGLEAVCRPENEAHVRVLLVQALMNSPLHLRLLETSDLEPGRLLLRAELVGGGRQERLLEEVAGRLSIERGVSAVRWRVLNGGAG